MIINTRVGKIGNCANYKRKKSSAIKLPKKYYGQLVVVISRREYREIIWKTKRLEGRLAKIRKITE